MKKYVMETTVGIFVVIGLVCVAYMTLKLGHVSFLGQNTYSLYAPFSTVSGLRAGSSVDLYGTPVGRVARITLDQKNQMAIVELSIEEGIKVYEDAIASIRTEGLIGDEYVSISPGGAEPLLKSGGTIIQTQPPVNITDLIGKYIFGGVKEGGENK